MHYISIQEAVWQAAESLMSQGVRPTVANVRDITQRGSAGTINDALKTWWQDLAQRISVRAVHPDIPEPVVAVMQQLWQLALTHGESAYQSFKDEAEQKIIAAEQVKISALTRQQHAENHVSTLEVRLEKLQQSERDLQTTVATETALRAQLEQQLEVVTLQSQKNLADAEAGRSQLEKELALLAAQYQRHEQQFQQQQQQLELKVYEQQQQIVAQTALINTSESYTHQAERALLQAQTELRLVQQRLNEALRDNAELSATLQRPIQKRDVLRAKLKRY